MDKSRKDQECHCFNLNTCSCESDVLASPCHSWIDCSMDKKQDASLLGGVHLERGVVHAEEGIEFHLHPIKFRFGVAPHHRFVIAAH